MASIYKKRKKRPIPDDADINRSRNTARWINGRGKKQTAKLSEDCKSIIIESSVWYARYRDHNDVEKQISTRCSDKQAAQQVLNDLIAEADKIRSGIKSAKEANASGHAKKSFSEHVNDYLVHLANKTTRGRKTSSVHVANVRRQLERLAKECKFSRLNDISKGRIAKWMNKQSIQAEMSGRTINTYRAAILAFVSWLLSEDRLVMNPLEGLHTADETEKRRKRRALTSMEIAKVLEVARVRPLQDAMTIRHGKRKGQLVAKVRPEVKKRLMILGYERVLMYKCMIYAGLRRNELATLTVSDLHLDVKYPFLRLKTKNSKNAMADDISLRADLAAELREWISCKLPGAKVFRVPKKLRDILYRDLKKARIPRIDDQGRQVDIHALRHTCGTQLARAGVSPQLASKIMRHSSIDMTLKHYTHLALTDTGRAVEMIPDFQNYLNVNKQTKTGTFDIRANEKSPEKGHVIYASTDISCPLTTTTSKRTLGDKKMQVFGNTTVGSFCHQKADCPGLESNQHDPKVTSPSS